MGGGAAGGVMEGMKPVAGMVVVQVVFAGVNIFYKLAVCDGMDMRVLIAYRYLFASVVLAPLAYFVERKKRTKLTWRVILLSFVCGLCGGSLAQNLYISGMKLTSATFASAMTNLIPAITFVLAVLFRYERLAVRTVPGQAKVAGTLLGVGGAMLLTFYKGAQVTLWPPTHINLAAQLAAHQHAASSEPSSSFSGGGAGDGGNRAMGSLLCMGSCFFYALWLILQARLSREYPFHYSTTALMCLMSALQSAAFALCFDRDVLQWRLGFDIRLLAVVYTGVLASGVMLVVLSWCVKRRGPLFASVFNPMMLVVVAVLSSLLLGEELHLGSVLGAVLIVLGLYAVLWGKGREAAAAAEQGKAIAAGEVPHIDVVVHRHPPPPPASPQQQQQQQQEQSPAAAR